MSLPFHIPKGTSLAVAKKILTRTVNDLFADRPAFDLTLAVGAGHRALERGEPFMDAVSVSEGVIKLWEDIAELEREHLWERRDRETVLLNRKRLAAYRKKLSTHERIGWAGTILINGGRA